MEISAVVINSTFGKPLSVFEKLFRRLHHFLRRIQRENMKKIVFHHCTTSESAAAIEKSGVIKQSKTKPDGSDVNYGEGTYGTPLGPENGRKELAQNNYGQAWQQFENMGRVDVVIRIVMDDSKVKHISVNGREIYVYSGDIILNEADEVDFISFTGAGKYEVKKYK